MPFKLLAMAFEQEIQEVVKKEREQEITIYARMKNPAGLAQANDTEQHIQAEVKISPTRRLRVRKTSINGQANEYTLTTKVNLGGSSENVRTFDERTAKISEEVFSMIRRTVESYQKKARYIFNVEKMTVTGNNQSLDIEGMKFEVDVYTNSNGSQSEWCKIDFEIQGMEEKFKAAGIDVQDFNISLNIGSLPFKPTDFIFMSDDTSEEDKAKVKQIYDEQFLIFNDRLPQEQQENGVEDKPVETGETTEQTQTDKGAKPEQSEQESSTENPEEATEPQTGTAEDTQEQ